MATRAFLARSEQHDSNGATVFVAEKKETTARGLLWAPGSQKGIDLSVSQRDLKVAFAIFLRPNHESSGSWPMIIHECLSAFFWIIFFFAISNRQTCGYNYGVTLPKQNTLNEHSLSNRIKSVVVAIQCLVVSAGDLMG